MFRNSYIQIFVPTLMILITQGTIGGQLPDEGTSPRRIENQFIRTFEVRTVIDDDIIVEIRDSDNLSAVIDRIIQQFSISLDDMSDGIIWGETNAVTIIGNGSATRAFASPDTLVVRSPSYSVSNFKDIIKFIGEQFGLYVLWQGNVGLFCSWYEQSDIVRFTISGVINSDDQSYFPETVEIVPMDGVRLQHSHIRDRRYILSVDVWVRERVYRLGDVTWVRYCHQIPKDIRLLVDGIHTFHLPIHMLTDNDVNEFNIHNMEGRLTTKVPGERFSADGAADEATSSKSLIESGGAVESEEEPAVSMD